MLDELCCSSLITLAGGRAAPCCSERTTRTNTSWPQIAQELALPVHSSIRSSRLCRARSRASRTKPATKRSGGGSSEFCLSLRRSVSGCAYGGCGAGRGRGGRCACDGAVSHGGHGTGMATKTPSRDSGGITFDATLWRQRYFRRHEHHAKHSCTQLQSPALNCNQRRRFC